MSSTSDVAPKHQWKEIITATFGEAEVGIDRKGWKFSFVGKGILGIACIAGLCYVAKKYFETNNGKHFTN